MNAKMMLSVALFHLFLLASTFIGAFEGDMSEAGLVSPFDGPDPGYIMAGSKDGLGNRLRALAGFMYIAEQHYSGAHLVFDWDVNSACPGHFLTLFEPLPHVTFISNNSRTLFDKHAKGVYSQSSANFRWILQSHQLPNNVSARNIIYAQFKPRKQFVDIAKAFVIKHDICNGSVIHMRMTDMDKILHPFHRQNLQKHMWYVESRPKEEKVFLMTDDPVVQQTFLKEFGEEKVVVYDKINQTSPHHLLPAMAVTGDLPATGSPIMPLPVDHRYTSLEHTFIDVLIAAHARHYKMAHYSSLSEFVRIFETIGKQQWGWCGKGYY